MSNLSMRTSTKMDAASLYGMTVDDIADRLAAIRHQESTSYRPVDYLAPCHTEDVASSSSSFASHHPCCEDVAREHRQSRAKMCHWCYQLADVCKLSRHAVGRSMNYLDRFLASRHDRARRSLVDKREYQLAAMTALYVSIKLHEPLAMDAGLLAEISQGCYDAAEVLDMERSIIEALEWRMNGPTPQELVSLYLGVLDPRAYAYDLDTLGSMLDVSNFQCELAMADYDLSNNCSPSIVALASIFNSLEGVGEGSLPARARYEFIARLCRILLTSGDIDMIHVGLVQSVLRRLFCRNSGVELPRETSCRPKRSRSIGNYGTSVPGNASTKGCNKIGQILYDDTKCSSPVSVTARKYSQLQHRERRFAK